MFMLNILIIIHATMQISANCEGLRVSSPFIIEYAVWRGWHEAVMYMPDQQGCRHTTVRLAKCLAVNGIGVAVPNMKNQRIINHLGIIIVSSRLSKNGVDHLSKTLKKLNDLQMNTNSYDWLITLPSFKDINNFTSIMKSIPIRFDQNLVVSYPTGSQSKSIICKDNFMYNRKGTDLNRLKNSRETRRRNGRRFSNEDYQNYTHGRNSNTYYKTSNRLKNLVKNTSYMKEGVKHSLFRSGLFYNYSRKFYMTAMNENYFKGTDKSPDNVKVLQYFKVRANSTLYGYLLGTWSLKQSMSFVEPPFAVEIRNFLGEQLVVGRSNSSGDGLVESDETESTAPELLENVLEFITVQLNATVIVRNFNKLGFRTFEGIWTGLLGELVDNKVDIALEPVTAYLARYRDMDFIFPIAKTMCNIYFRHQETLTTRDIFLTPFSARLILGVFAVTMLIAVLAVVISRLITRVSEKSGFLGLGEALLWSTGIMCQQGSTSTPKTTAARVLLIVSLLFAIITYNSYAAFITSVLSVRETTVDTVEAVLQAPNMKIGYIRNGADQMYLMSTKDTQLNAFYIRGYSAAENLVTTVEEGLVRAVTQDYAFFAGLRAARTKLRTFSEARGRCLLHELPVPSTKAHFAFPIPHNSPYAKLILISLISLKSGGSLPLLGEVFVPKMPECAPPPGFQSARAADVRSAFVLLCLGAIIALVLGFGEFIWKNKIKLLNYVRRYRNNIVNH